MSPVGFCSVCGNEIYIEAGCDDSGKAEVYFSCNCWDHLEPSLGDVDLDYLTNTYSGGY